VVIIQWPTSQSRQLRVLFGGILANADDDGTLLERRLDYKVMMFLGKLLGLGNILR
jgi:hypothetical protein